MQTEKDQRKKKIFNRRFEIQATQHLVEATLSSPPGI